MLIKRLTIKNFGKIHEKNMEFSRGINVLYGENESGKTTMHTFLKSMLYGIRRQRGRAARTDAYSTYEPWENPSVYGGILWFESGGKNFRLTRNFYKMNLKCELLCEDDGEILDVEKGDLEVVLGGISEAIYENTVSVAQLKSVTGQDLVRELQNYMASYQGTGDSTVDLGRAMQMLKMSRKGFQVQAQKRKKETEKEKEKLALKMEYVRKDMDKLMEQQEDVYASEESLQMTREDDGEELLNERIESVLQKLHANGALMAATLVGTMLVIIGFNMFLPGIFYPGILAGLVGMLLFGLEFLQRRRLDDELERREHTKTRWMHKQERLRWNRESISESLKEKETALENLQADFREVQETAYLPLSEELEIDALNLAMDTIERLSGNIHNHVGESLRLRTSRILSEITGGKYQEVLMDAGFHMAVNTSDRTIPLANLSRGTMEQIYFALRMAAGELLCGGERFPVILDDVFGMYDDERLSSVLRWLHKEQRQVIISTCHKREMEILEKEGIPYAALPL